MSLGLMTMSKREIDRAEWMLRLAERWTTHAEVVEHRGLGLRQVSTNSWRVRSAALQFGAVVRRASGRQMNKLIAASTV